MIWFRQFMRSRKRAGQIRVSTLDRAFRKAVNQLKKDPKFRIAIPLDYLKAAAREAGYDGVFVMQRVSLDEKGNLKYEEPWIQKRDGSLWLRSDSPASRSRRIRQLQREAEVGADQGSGREGL